MLRGEAEVDQALAAEAIGHINRLYTGRALEMAREIGGYVLDTFFGGDPNSFGDRWGEHKSFSALADHPELQFSRVWLWRAVSVYDQLKLLPENIADALPYTHHTLLLPLHDETKNVELAKKAVEKGWTRDVLQAEVAKVREKEKTSKGGRKPLLPFVKTVNRFEKLLADADESFGGLDQLDQLEDEDLKHVRGVLARMKLKLDEVTARLDSEAE